MVFQHVKPEDAGLYTCVAQTSTGKISCSAELTVQGAVKQLVKDPEKPKLESEERRSEVTAGGSAMLDLRIKGYPKPDIKWTKDGAELITGGRIRYLWEDEESLSLVIKNVVVDDAGIYTIKARNELGEDSTQIELIVKSAPKIIKAQKDMMQLETEDITMAVQIQGSPTPEVKWFKDGQQIDTTTSGRFSATREGDVYKLQVKSLTMNDQGSYSIVAKNEINQTSDFWSLTIKVPPKIKKRLGQPKVVNESDSLTLFIEVETDPEPSVEWIKDETVIKADERVKIIHEGEKFMLKIDKVTGTDAGEYKAKISNAFGSLFDATRVQVFYITLNYIPFLFISKLNVVYCFLTGQKRSSLQKGDNRRGDQRGRQERGNSRGDRGFPKAKRAVVLRHLGDHQGAQGVHLRGRGELLQVDHQRGKNRVDGQLHL